MVNSYEDVLGWIGDETTRLFDIAIENAPVSGGIFVEAGTYRGKSSICLYDKIQQSGKDIKLYTIDPWTLNLPHDAPEDVNRDIFIENIGTRQINLIDSTSYEAIDLFLDNSIDFLFIDNDTQGELLRIELIDWEVKLKIGGIISGHDYHWTYIKEVVDALYPNVTVLVETTERVGEFSYQPSLFRLTSWYSFIG
jgi:predicted O-methyltransferase YrrM